MPPCPFVPDLRFTLAYAKAYLLLRHIGESLVKEAIRFDQAIAHFDTAMRLLEYRVNRLRHCPGAQDYFGKKEMGQDWEARAAKRRLSEVNTPCSRYVKHHGVWKDVGELIRRSRWVYHTTTTDEANYFSYRDKRLERSGIDPPNSYWSRRTPKGLRRDT